MPTRKTGRSRGDRQGSPTPERRARGTRSARKRATETGLTPDSGRPVDADDEARLGPYEARYDIAHGYGTERRIIVP